MLIGNANATYSYERLEFLGDSVLKFLMTTYLHSKYPNHGEDKLTIMRSNLVDNHSLYQLAKAVSNKITNTYYHINYQKCRDVNLQRCDGVLISCRNKNVTMY